MSPAIPPLRFLTTPFDCDAVLATSEEVKKELSSSLHSSHALTFSIPLSMTSPTTPSRMLAYIHILASYFSPAIAQKSRACSQHSAERWEMRTRVASCSAVARERSTSCTALWSKCRRTAPGATMPGCPAAAPQ